MWPHAWFLLLLLYIYTIFNHSCYKVCNSVKLNKQKTTKIRQRGCPPEVNWQKTWFSQKSSFLFKINKNYKWQLYNFCPCGSETHFFPKNIHNIHKECQTIQKERQPVVFRRKPPNVYIHILPTFPVCFYMLLCEHHPLYVIRVLLICFFSSFIRKCDENIELQNMDEVHIWEQCHKVESLILT
jgi:hypothetical protein